MSLLSWMIFVFMCIYLLISKSFHLKSGELPFHFTFPNPRKDTSIALSEIFKSNILFSDNKLASCRLFHKLTFSLIKHRSSFSLGFLPVSHLSWFPSCPPQLGLTAPSIPMHPCPLSHYCQPDPNPVLTHHFHSHVQLKTTGENQDTLGLMSINQ